MPGVTAPGISGDDQYALLAQTNHRFLVDNILRGNNFMNGATISKTASYTVVESETGAAFDNTGASGTITFTLPTVAKAGLQYKFTNVAGETVTILSGSSNIHQGTAKSTFSI